MNSFRDMILLASRVLRSPVPYSLVQVRSLPVFSMGLVHMEEPSNSPLISKEVASGEKWVRTPLKLVVSGDDCKNAALDPLHQ